MSLLMKALEKAAKDRVEGEPPAAPPATVVPPAAGGPGIKPGPELTLEPVAALKAEPAAASRATAPSERTTTPANAAAATPRDSARAAAMIRAAGQSESDGNVFSYLRDRPLIALGAVATIFLLAFGAYVYIQMNPAMFITQAPRPAATVPIAPAVVAATQSGATTTVPVVPQPVALTSLLPPTDQSAGKDKVAPLSPQLAGSSASAAAATPATAAVTPAVVSAATPALSVPQTPRDTIKVTTGNTAPAINPVLSEAYAALTAGNVEASQRLYNQLLKSDPRNVESLLGLAAIATQQGDRDTATKHYVKILELDPRNAVAQAGLIGMVGRADPQSAETRVKQLIAREPSAAFLYFTLGNTYIDQSRWPDAQQAFFQAHHLQPENPDYAYNLAVALEHMGQPKSALDFYRRAVQLAAARGRANFDVAAAQQRVGKLENAVQ